MVEMIMQALPEIAKNVAEPLSKVDRITMFGEGNNTKLLEDIVKGTLKVCSTALASTSNRSWLASSEVSWQGAEPPPPPSPAPQAETAEDTESASPKEKPDSIEE